VSLTGITPRPLLQTTVFSSIPPEPLLGFFTQNCYNHLALCITSVYKTSLFLQSYLYALWLWICVLVVLYPVAIGRGRICYLGSLVKRYICITYSFVITQCFVWLCAFTLLKTNTREDKVFKNSCDSFERQLWVQLTVTTAAITRQHILGLNNQFI
jgi:hypothetical protein